MNYKEISLFAKAKKEQLIRYANDVIKKLFKSSKDHAFYKLCDSLPIKQVKKYTDKGILCTIFDLNTSLLMISYHKTFIWLKMTNTQGKFKSTERTIELKHIKTSNDIIGVVNSMQYRLRDTK
jgi:hypothetical protein